MGLPSAFSARARGGLFLILGRGLEKKKRKLAKIRRRFLVAQCLQAVLAYSSVRTRSVLTNTALTGPAASAWRTLFCSNDEGAYMSVLGVTPVLFRSLVQVFAPFYKRAAEDIRGYVGNGSKRGRKSALSAADALGLVLHFLGTKVQRKCLSLIFGVGPATTSRAISAGLSALEAALGTMQEAEVRFPSHAEARTFAEQLEHKEPKVAGCMGFIDGLNLPIPTPDNTKDDPAYYNGWQHGHFVTNVFLWTPDGCVCFCVVNSPVC